MESVTGELKAYDDPARCKERLGKLVKHKPVEKRDAQTIQSYGLALKRGARARGR